MTFSSALESRKVMFSAPRLIEFDLTPILLFLFVFEFEKITRDQHVIPDEVRNNYTSFTQVVWGVRTVYLTLNTLASLQ